MKPHPEITPWFFGVWLALMIVGVWITHLDRNIARKKRLLPVPIVVAGVLFVLATFWMTGDWRAMGFVIPAAALVTVLIVRQFRVCAACGRIINSGMWIARTQSCPKCDGRLD
jgi:hypothetical protein